MSQRSVSISMKIAALGPIGRVSLTPLRCVCRAAFDWQNCLFVAAKYILYLLNSFGKSRIPILSGCTVR